MRERKNEEGVATWLLRKRVRPNIRRITSLRQFSAEDTAAAAAVGEEIQRQLHFRQREQRRAAAVEEFAKIAKNRSFNGSGATEMTAQFLMVCSFCNSHIGPGRDAFMYRGDISFCSHECRQQRMDQDELKRKELLTSKRIVATSSSTGSTIGPTVVAA